MAFRAVAHAVAFTAALQTFSQSIIINTQHTLVNGAAYLAPPSWPALNFPIARTVGASCSDCCSSSRRLRVVGDFFSKRHNTRCGGGFGTSDSSYGGRRDGGGALRMVITPRSEGVSAATDATKYNLASAYPLESPAGSKLVGHGIRKEEWEALLAAGDEVSLREGELLVSQGDQPEDSDKREVFLLLSGQCRLEVRGAEVALLLPGDFVGEGTSGCSIVECIGEGW